MDNLNNIKSACFTGYRPEKFNFKLNNKNTQYKQLISNLCKIITSLYDNGCRVFYCGMAPGFDIIAAECVIKLAKKQKDIHLVCVIPYLDHENSINTEWKKRYNNVLVNSNEIVYVTTEYKAYCFQLRNRYMVDHSNCTVCWYDGKAGGTRNTIKYAKSLNKNIINVNFDYKIELNNTQQLFLDI